MKLYADSGEVATEDLEKKLLLALELFDLGVSIKEQSLRREHPDLSERELGEKLRDWLQTRPGGEFGDCSGRPVPLESFGDA